MKLLLSLFVFLLSIIFIGCSSQQSPQSREPSTDGNVKIPVDTNVPWAKAEMLAKGGDPSRIKAFASNNYKQMAEMWHLGEGSEIYPLAWMIRLKSKTQNACGNRNKKIDRSSYFIDHMDYKIGATWDPIPSRFPLRYIGLTAVWSSMRPEDSNDSHVSRTEVLLDKGIALKADYDAEIEKRRTLGSEWDQIKMLKGAEAPVFEYKGLTEIDIARLGFKKENQSIAMSGVNCTFCHSGSINSNGHEYIVDGIPNVVSSGDFFGDLTLSTIGMMLDDNALEEFLLSFPSIKARSSRADIRAYSKDFVSHFKNELLNKSESFIKEFGGDLFKAIDQCSPIADKIKEGKKKAVKHALYQNRDITKKYLVELIDYTFGFGGTQNVPPTVVSRMEWLAYVLGLNKNISMTLQGYGRTDAFGRVGNWLLPYHKQGNIDAPASSPYMWGMKYRPMFNYPANTNSVTVRNLLQSIGLGATLPWFNRNSTTADIEKALSTEPWRLYATTNMHVMNRIENLLYGIRIPNFYAVFKNASVKEGATVKTVSESATLKSYSKDNGNFYFEQNDPDIRLSSSEINKAVAGCNTYLKTCFKCHDSAGSLVIKDFGKARVGTNGNNWLISESAFHKNVVGTDPNHANNLARLIQNTPDPITKKDEFWATGKTIANVLWPVFTAVENGYYERWMSNDPNMATIVADWRNEEFRGQQVIRDGTAHVNQSRIQPENHNLDYVELKEDRHYVARHLSGIWATAPFLHNGSVPTIWQLLTPAEQRIKKFFVMSKDYNMDELGYEYQMEKHPRYDEVKKSIFGFLGTEKELCRVYPYSCFNTSEPGNSNMGHSGSDYGTELSVNQKHELIAFLKVLQPEPEFAWKTKPVYKMDMVAQKCSPNEL